MIRSKDWKPTMDARVLLICEDANLQWSDRMPEYPHFVDYFFRKKPYDHGERSRYMEAKNLIEMIEDLTHFGYSPKELFVTCLSSEQMERAPKGKRTLIPQVSALRGLEHIKWLLENYPTIETVFICSMQANYWIHQAGLVPVNDVFLKGAEPRRTGVQSDPPFYQPVNPKSFAEICALETHLVDYPHVKVFPLLAVRDYPLKDRNLEQYGERYAAIEASFQK